MKRTPLKRRTPLRQSAWRTRTRDRVPTSVRREVRARSGGRCELKLFALKASCDGDAVHMHHKLPRGRGGEHTAKNLLHLCATCHRFIHDHPAWSASNGFLLSGSEAS